jgi:putative transposase
MKKTQFTETQIVKALKDYDGGRSADDVSRELGIRNATLYDWKSKYGGMKSSDVKRLNELEEENSRLKEMCADLAMDNRILKDIFKKKGWDLPTFLLPDPD